MNTFYQKQEAVGSLYSCASQTSRKQVGNKYIVGDEIENHCHVTWNGLGMTRENVNGKSVSQNKDTTTILRTNKIVSHEQDR